MNKVAFEKTIKNVSNNRDVKPITTEAERNYYLVSEQNYHTTKIFRIIYKQNK